MSSSEKQNIAVTGAGGVLGLAVASRLSAAGASVYGIGRHSAPPSFTAHWRLGDLLDLKSAHRALAGIDTIVHCASTPRQPQNDRLALKNLIAAAKQNNSRLVYVSICGIEGAAQYLEYYRVKLADEAELTASGIPWTIVRISQFHPFTASILSRLLVGPFVLRPRITLQPVDVDFAASQLSHYVTTEVMGRAPDIHGPEKLNQDQLIGPWLAAEHLRKLSLAIPAFGPLQAFGNLVPAQGVSGGPTWTQWLASEKARHNPYLSRGK